MKKAIVSPKITFHSEPKIQSPKISLLADPIRKKSVLDSVSVGLENLSRKKSEDDEKIIPFRAISPGQAFKSPSIVNKTPLQQVIPQ